MTAKPAPDNLEELVLPEIPAEAAVRSAVRPMSIARLDIERRLGLPAGPFTQPGPVMPAALALLATVGFYAALVPLGDAWFARTFTERGWVPYAIVSFSFWALFIILIKSSKVRLQSRAMRRAHEAHVVPDDPQFAVSPATAQRVLNRLYSVAEEPKDFILLNRIQFALANLKNMGRIGDVGDVLRSRAEAEEAAADSSYTIVRGLVWAIPVLGFIGTVLGLSQAIGHFGAVLSEAADLSQLRPELQKVTAGLATAFETTLQALVAALIIQLLVTVVRRNEERMFDGFAEYCDRHIVGRLRLTDGGGQG